MSVADGLSDLIPLPPEAGGGKEKGPCLELPERKAAPENPSPRESKTHFRLLAPRTVR